MSSGEIRPVVGPQAEAFQEQILEEDEDFFTHDELNSK
jgi:hypothetical protein